MLTNNPYDTAYIRPIAAGTCVSSNEKYKTHLSTLQRGSKIESVWKYPNSILFLMEIRIDLWVDSIDDANLNNTCASFNIQRQMHEPVHKFRPFLHVVCVIVLCFFYILHHILFQNRAARAVKKRIHHKNKRQYEESVVFEAQDSMNRNNMRRLYSTVNGTRHNAA